MIKSNLRFVLLCKNLKKMSKCLILLEVSNYDVLRSPYTSERLLIESIGTINNI